MTPAPSDPSRRAEQRPRRQNPWTHSSSRLRLRNTDSSVRGPALPVALPPNVSFVGLLVSWEDFAILRAQDLERRRPLLVGIRDLGEDVDATLWQDELERLAGLECPEAAPLSRVAILEDRFVCVVTEAEPDGESASARAARGELSLFDIKAIGLALLDVTMKLHARGLAAPVLGLDAVALVPTPSGADRVVVTMYGLHIDHQADVAQDLRDIASLLRLMLGEPVETPHVDPSDTAVARGLRALIATTLGEAGVPYRTAAAMRQALELVSACSPRARRARVGRETMPGLGDRKDSSAQEPPEL